MTVSHWHSVVQMTQDATISHCRINATTVRQAVQKERAALWVLPNAGLYVAVSRLRKYPFE